MVKRTLCLFSLSLEPPKSKLAEIDLLQKLNVKFVETLPAENKEKFAELWEQNQDLTVAAAEEHGGILSLAELTPLQICYAIFIFLPPSLFDVLVKN